MSKRRLACSLLIHKAFVSHSCVRTAGRGGAMGDTKGNVCVFRKRNHSKQCRKIVFSTLSARVIAHVHYLSNILRLRRILRTLATRFGNTLFMKRGWKVQLSTFTKKSIVGLPQEGKARMRKALELPKFHFQFRSLKGYLLTRG